MKVSITQLEVQYYEITKEIELTEKEYTQYLKNGIIPKGIKDDIEYTIRGIYGEGIEVALNSSNGIGWLQSIKVHRSYMIPKYALRDINLNRLLD